MEDYDIDIPETLNEEDFTVIYKGPKGVDRNQKEGIVQIKTSKDAFLQKLRYFNPKTLELGQTDEIYIHDKYPLKIFEEFIQTLTRKKIRVNDNNYAQFHDLSTKYQYLELKQQIDIFSETRPDVNKLVNQFQTDKIDYNKEESISKHLDICLRNDRMTKFPIEVLIRILNSPKRQIKDHHLLFNFVKNVIDNYGEASTEEEIESKRENVELLLSSLDYTEMSNEELEELFNNENYTNVFNNRGTAEIMKAFIDERKNTQIRIDELEQQMKIQEQNYSRQIEDMRNTQNQMIEQIKAICSKVEELNQSLCKSEQEKETLQDSLSKQEKRMDEYERRIAKIEEEERSKHEIEGTIEIRVEGNSTIKGRIIVKEEGVTLDKKKSKFVLNTIKSSELGQNGYKNGLCIEKLNQEFTINKKAGTYWMHALLVDERGKSKEIVSSSVTIKTLQPLTFEYTGRVQSVTLEPGSYKLEVWGAEGGRRGKYSNKAGKGGYSVGKLNLSKRTPLYVYVGESPNSISGGWNGGGSGSENGRFSGSVGGGGATDISLCGTEGSREWKSDRHMHSRIIVAGAGGGSGRNGDFKGLAGCGGGETGGCSQHGPSDNGGSQTGANAGYCYSEGQGFGVGGTHTGECSSGGGGGWYGGGASGNSGIGTGGAGGSGYVFNSSTAANYPSGCLLSSEFYLADSSTLSGESSFPSPSGSSNENGHSGHGYAKITPL